MATKRTKGTKAKSKTTEAKAAKTSKTAKMPKKITLAGLNRWNIGLAVIFALQAVAILVLSKSVDVPVTTHFLTNNTLASQVAGHTVYGPAVRHLFDINLAYLLVAILAIAGLIHVLIATVWRKKYEADLAIKLGRIRWMEYAIVGGLALVTIALVNGIYDISLLLSIYALVVLTALFSMLLEQYRQKVTIAPWFVNTFAGITALLPWLVIAIYLFSAQLYGSMSLPSYVYWLDATIFLLYLASAGNMYMGNRQKERWADYLYTERTYMVISLVLKTALVWQIFAGALR